MNALEFAVANPEAKISHNGEKYEIRLMRDGVLHKLSRSIRLQTAISAYLQPLKEALEQMTAERDLLQDILDGRPAINAGLPETYVRWSQSIYSGDAVRATMKGK